MSQKISEDHFSFLLLEISLLLLLILLLLLLLLLKPSNLLLKEGDHFYLLISAICVIIYGKSDMKLFSNSIWALWIKKLWLMFEMRLRLDFLLCILLNLKATLGLEILSLDVFFSFSFRSCLLYAHEESTGTTLPRRWIPSSY